MNILHVTSSPRAASYSNRVAADVLAELRRRNPDATVTTRDLARDSLPHIDDDFIVATRSPAGPQTEQQRALLARSDALTDELLAADVVVIATPMINFTIPSTLKAWLDYVHVIGANSPVGEGIDPLRSKPVTVISARSTPTGEDPQTDFVLGPFFAILGGFMSMDVQGFVVHTEPPAAPGDFHRPYDVVRDEVLASIDR